MITDVSAYAEAYVRNFGWRVIPIWWVNDDGTCGCGASHEDSPSNVGKHPITVLAPSGLRDASSDVDVVRRWWSQFPRANVAVACDSSGLVVVDVDPRNGGDESLEFIERTMTPMPYTLQASTGGGGRHLFYEAPVGLQARGRLGKGVDVKHAGYVLLPPSNHASGGSYSWATENVAPQALSPDALALVARDPSGGNGHARNGNGSTNPGSFALGVEVVGQPLLDLAPLFDGTLGPGERHEFFKSYAGSLRARRWRREEAVAWITDRWADVQQHEHPFPLEEAVKLVEWVYDNRPEGTTMERQLEDYQLWLDTYATPSISSVISDQESTAAPDVNAEIAQLPDALREAVLARLLQEEAGEYVRNVRERLQFVAPVSRLSLADELALPDPPLPWTVRDLWVAGSNVTLVAMYKTGKTVFHLNLAKALVDNEPFLGRFETRQLSGRVGIVNAELDEALWRDWARRVGMRNLGAASVLHLRGFRVDVSTDVGREWLASWCREREIEVLLLDPFARLFYGDENQATPVKQWTDAVDVLKREAGVIDAHVAVHAGRVAERLEADELPRARGSTRLDDWPDALWMLLREGRERDAPRYLAVEGRRVALDETELVYDDENLRLAVAQYGGNRRTQRNLRGVDDVVRVLTEAGAHSEETGITSRHLRSSVGGAGTEADAAVERSIRLGRVRVVSGPNRSRLHYLVAEDQAQPMVWEAGGVHGPEV